MREKLSDKKLKEKGFRTLIKELGQEQAEKFINLISKESFDYTKWQSTLWSEDSVENISERAMDYVKKLPPAKKGS